MTVAVSSEVPQAAAGGGAQYFCCEHCREAFVADPERYAATG